MAVLPIVITGDPVLHSPAREVDTIDQSITNLVRDMRDTMLAAPGVGLAAPQVGVDLRVFVWRWSSPTRLHAGVVINPELTVSPIEPCEPDPETESEGCLSVPGVKFALRRSPRAVLTGLDLRGQPFELRADGWLARILQHETDHLDGTLYVDRLASPHAEAAAAHIRAQGWGVPGQTWVPGAN